MSRTERSNRLAHELIARGVGADVPVALCFERSLEMVVALLAVLKAGGGYVALDPSHPPARLAALLDDARPPVLLTLDRLREDARLVDRCPSCQSPLNVVLLHGEQGSCTACGATL